jgi:hypothetical protein
MNNDEDLINRKPIELLDGGEDIGDNGRFDFSSKNIFVSLPRSESLDILSDGCESDVDQFLGCQIGDNEIGTIDVSSPGPLSEEGCIKNDPYMKRPILRSREILK